MHEKAQELARAEAELRQTELAAAAAKKMAEDAVLQLETAKAAEEAKESKEEEEEGEKKEEVNQEHQQTEQSEQDKDEKTLNQVDENERQYDEQTENKSELSGTQTDTDSPVDLKPQEHEEQDNENENNLLEEDSTTSSSAPYSQEMKETSEAENKEKQEDTKEEAEIMENQVEFVDPPPKMLPDLALKLEPEENRKPEPEKELKPKPEKEVKSEQKQTLKPEEKLKLEPEPELTTQRVFQEVHVVQESRENTPREAALSRNKWSRFIYSIDSGDWDTGLGCVVRSGSRQLSHGDLEVSRVHCARAALVLSASEELVSNVICLAPSGGQGEGTTVRFIPAISISLPHCAPRLHPGKEPVVRMRPLKGGSWQDLATTDVSFDDIKEYKFVEAKLPEPGTLCVVLRLKREVVQINPRQGGKFMSSADSRVTLTWPHQAVTSPTDLTVAVQQLDQNLLSELRMRAEFDCGTLMSCSPIIHCRSQGSPLCQPVTFSLPCPPNPAARPTRPSTGVQRSERRVERVGDGGKGGADQRPATARPFFTTTAKKVEEVPEDEVHVLCRQSKGKWSKVTDVTFQLSRKKDLVVFEMDQFVSRLLVVRMRSGFSSTAVEQTATIMEYMLSQHAIHLVLRQHAQNPTQVTLTYSSAPYLARTLRTLEEEGYKQGPPPSSEIRLREGQILELSFRGNLKPGGEFVPVCGFFNSIPFQQRFSISEIDQYAQKGFNSYRGFVQMTTHYEVPFRRTSHPSVTAEGDRKPEPACFIQGRCLLAELLASVPKPEPETPRPLTTAPVCLKSHGPVTNDLLQYVAKQLAADDWRRLAPMLNIRRMRLQAILRQNLTTPSWLPIYDVLLTWSKRLPQAFDRVDMLCAALMSVGRNDLVEEVRDKENSFRQKLALSTRDSLLHKAFVRIARHEKAVSQWRRLALFLGVGEDTVKVIMDSTSSARERCMQSLQQWKAEQDRSGDQMASVTLLSHKLRLCRYRALARDIDAIR